MHISMGIGQIDAFLIFISLTLNGLNRICKQNIRRDWCSTCRLRFCLLAVSVLEVVKFLLLSFKPDY